MGWLETRESHHCEPVHWSPRLSRLCFIIVHSFQESHTFLGIPCGNEGVELYVLAPGILPYKASSSAVQQSA